MDIFAGEAGSCSGRDYLVPVWNEVCASTRPAYFPPRLRGVVFIRQAAALASYAKQAKDEELEKMARRIRARAIRRAGELLNAIEPAHGAHRKTDGVDSFSRTDAAREAGLSERQQYNAVRVANVPESDFEQAVEGDDPPPARGE